MSDKVDFKEYTPTLNTSAYSANDQMEAGAVLVAGLTYGDGAGSILQTVTVLDKTGTPQDADFTIYFFRNNPSVTGGINGAIGLTATNAAAAGYMGKVLITGYESLGSVSVAVVKDLTIPLKAETGTNGIYVLLKTGGSPTYAAGSLVINFGLMPDKYK